MHRGASGFFMLALLVTTSACEAVDRVRNRGVAVDTSAISASAGDLTLGLQTPGALQPGEEGIVRLTLANRGDTVPRGLTLELLVPSWMEPMPPRPGDRAVTMSASAEEGTRFSYRMDDQPPEPGQMEIVEQRIRVPVGSSVTEGSAPWSRLVRARLVSQAGEPLAQVESEVAVGTSIVGDTSAVPGVGSPREGGDRLGPIRLGMGSAALRQAAPGTRDTTWTAEGTRERGVVVPMERGGLAVALISGDTVARIEVRDSLPRTAEGLGVGSTLGELRAAYGRACAGAGEGDVVVWFPEAPGVSFALGAPAAAAGQARVDAERLPASSRVSRWWLRRGTDSCP